MLYTLCGKCSKKEGKRSKTGIKKILVPLDDSLKSTKALDTASAILKTAKSGRYDLVVMGSSGKGLIKEAILDSVSNFILHKSTIPVLIVKESTRNSK